MGALFGGGSSAPTITPTAADPNERDALDIARERRLLEQRRNLQDRNSLIVPSAREIAASGLFIPPPNA